MTGAVSFKENSYPW